MRTDGEHRNLRSEDREIVRLRYMDAFFGRAPLESLELLLARDLVFEGPFHQSTTASDYLDALRADPPAGASYELEAAFESADEACLVYLFSKPGVRTRMAQTFGIANGRICTIRLVFDTNAFR